jgi:hypothetical protein
MMKSVGGLQANRPGVTAIRFSPDGSHLAVAVEGYFSGTAGGSRLIILTFAHPNGGIQQFTIPGGAVDGFPLSIPPALSWDPLGQLVLAGTNLIRIKDGYTCGIPGTLGEGFLGVNEIVTLAVHKFGPFKIDFFTSDCARGDSWKVYDREWALADISPERGLISVSRQHTAKTDGDVIADLAVVDPKTRKIVRSWPADVGRQTRFVNHGTVLCAGNIGENVISERVLSPRCMSVDDLGKPPLEASTVKGGAPFAAGENSDRIILTDYAHRWNSVFGEYDTTIKRRVVWSVVNGTEVVSWTPKTQHYEIQRATKAIALKKPFSFAISADGQYVAEGGNDILNLYRIEP